MTEAKVANGSKISPAWVAVTITILIQISALIWGAAKIDSSNKQLQATTAKLEVTITSLQATIVNIDRRLAIIEDRQRREQ